MHELMVNQQIQLKLLIFSDGLKSFPCISLCMKGTVLTFIFSYSHSK